jgi:hypothetical protein
MNGVINAFYENTSWLYTILFQSLFFFIDYWSFVHFWCGIMLFLLAASKGVKQAILKITVLLILYEVIELLFLWFALHIFRPETITDQLTDILIGLIGAYTAMLFIKLKHSKQKSILINLIPIVFTSLTVAFLWVGNYHYTYNYKYLNNTGLNLWAFFWWSISGCFFLETYLFLKSKIKKTFYVLLTNWLLYFILLLIIEFIGYYILQIREVGLTHKTALIWGLIHGNTTMHVYYLIFPFLLSGVYDIIASLLSTAKQLANR